MKTPDPNSIAAAIERLLRISDIRACLPLAIFILPLGLYFFANNTLPASLIDWITLACAGLVLLSVYCVFKKWG